MIAKVSSTEASIMDEMLMCPTSLQYLSQMGRQPELPWERGEHNDGCGFAFAHRASIEIHKRDRKNSWDESYQALIKTAHSKIFIAHNRLATKHLNTTVEAAHPFFYQPGKVPYGFSHNGSIKTFIPAAQLHHTSDSFILMQELVNRKEKDPATDFGKIITSIARETDYNSLCGMLMTPEEMWVWRIYNDEDPANLEIYEAYYTLYLSLRKGAAVVSSEPLDEENWELLPNKTFLHLQPFNGKLQVNYSVLTI
jgi:predicted glutamine amidotransferase